MENRNLKEKQGRLKIVLSDREDITNYLIEAVNQAKDRIVVELPPGTFYVSTTIELNHHSISIVGNQTTLVFTGSGSLFHTYYTCTIKDLKLLGAKRDPDSAAIKVARKDDMAQGGCYFKGLTIEDCRNGIIIAAPIEIDNDVTNFGASVIEDCSINITPSYSENLDRIGISIECLRRFRKAKKIDLRKFSYDLNLSRC